MKVVREHGSGWIGVEASVVRGRIEAKVTGNISIGSSDDLRLEIDDLGVKRRSPLLLDLRDTEVGIDAPVAMTLFLASVRAAVGSVPIAIVGDPARLASLYLRAVGPRVMWFDGPEPGRRWLRRQMVS